MTKEEIKKLARQIAEENYNCTGNEKGINLMAMEYEYVLKRVQKDYCIVPKEVVRAIYNRKTIPTQEDINKKFIEECVIDAIFPDLFEQKGE